MSIPIPKSVTHVEGCTCSGGGWYHELSCGLWDRDVEALNEAVDAARARAREWAAAQWRAEEAPG